jgi:hypothetical protein
VKPPPRTKISSEPNLREQKDHVKSTSENKITDLTSDSGNEHLDVVDFREQKFQAV